MTDRNVTVIPATKAPIHRLAGSSAKKRRVAGYARVSTEKDEQYTSYEAQVDYYTQFIQSHAGWEFVKVYTDEGISGLGTRKRDGFNEMIEDALSGSIDLIITKSVSRFARNTVDSLVTIRKLKEKGVEVYFEKENIYSLDGKGELLLTIMSSLAQEESRSISENVTWGQRKRFSDGKVSLPYKQFLGYDRGEDKNDPPVVNPEQAVIVRRIYRTFMEGKTAGAIAKELTEEGIPTPAGKNKWWASTINSILQNEKYRGSALLQKCFTTDFLTKKQKVNEGEVPQYYIEHSHEVIIVPLEWDAVQDEIRRRKEIGRAYSGTSVFSAKLVCGDCGGWSGIRPGTRPTNTAPQSGAAIKSTLMGSASAVLQQSPMRKSKTDLFRCLTVSFLPGSLTSKPAERQNRRSRIQPPLTLRWRICSGRLKLFRSLRENVSKRIQPLLKTRKNSIHGTTAMLKNMKL